MLASPTMPRRWTPIAGVRGVKDSVARIYIMW